jgi:hypothetical protein
VALAGHVADGYHRLVGGGDTPGESPPADQHSVIIFSLEQVGATLTARPGS